MCAGAAFGHVLGRQLGGRLTQRGFDLALQRASAAHRWDAAYATNPAGTRAMAMAAAAAAAVPSVLVDDWGWGSGGRVGGGGGGGRGVWETNPGGGDSGRGVWETKTYTFSSDGELRGRVLVLQPAIPCGR